MKMQPVVKYLHENLPKYTNKFSDTITISSIVAENNLAVATLSSPLPPGTSQVESLTIANAVVAVNILNFDVVDGVATIRTPRDHGMVLNFNFKNRSLVTVAYLRTFSDSTLNGDFEVFEVPNRFVFRFKTSLADGIYPIDGVVLNYVSSVFNGSVDATIIDSTHISYPVNGITEQTRTVETSELHYNIRITRAADVSKTSDAYTNYEKDGYIQNKYYAFVVAENTTTSKDRNITTDAVATPASDDKYYFMYEDMHICVYAPTSEDILAGDTRDDLEDIKLALLRTLLYYTPVKQYESYNQFSLMFAGDNEILYNRDRLARAYTFQCQYQLGIQDGNLTQGTLVPFRDISLLVNINENRDAKEKLINLDVQPKE